MRCKRCGSIDIVLFKDIHRCKVCDSTNIIDETAVDIKQGDGLENKLYLKASRTTAGVENDGWI